MRLDASETRLVVSSLVENDRASLEVLFGQRVRELRTERGWSQSELGKRMKAYGHDLSQTTVAKLENGKRPIRLNEAQALCDIFGVAFSDLAEHDDGTPGLVGVQAVLTGRRRHFETMLRDVAEKIATTQAERDVAAARLDQLHRQQDEYSAKLEETEAALRGEIDIRPEDAIEWRRV